jgi:hypothetical protein
MRRKKKKKPAAVTFHAQWLGGVKVGLGESLACVHRITLQVSAEAFQELKEMTRHTPGLSLTINKNQEGGHYNVDPKPGQRSAKHSHGAGERERAQEIAS